ncbi:MAG: hypothetical protein ABJF50_02980 [Paracoccaceae bacterium]
MTKATGRVKSELPGGDPALMNRIAWARRWTDRDASTEYAINALQTAKDGQGRRSRKEQGYAMRTLAWHARWRGEFDAALEYSLKAESFLSETEHPVTRAWIYASLGMVHFVRSRLDLGMAAVDRGLWLVRDLSDEHTTAAQTNLYVVRSMIQQQGGERARAGMTLSRARELAGAEDLPLVEQITANWLLRHKEVERALEFALQALGHAKDAENKIIQPYIHAVAGSCFARQKNTIEALSHFNDGTKLAEEDQDQRALCYLNLSRAQFELARGETETARDLLLAGAAIAKRQNLPLMRKETALVLADTFEMLGQFKASVDQHKLAWRLEREGRIH